MRAPFIRHTLAANSARRGRSAPRREQVSAALRESESRLRANLENTPNVAVQWYDPDGRVVYWNPASEKRPCSSVRTM